MKKRKKPGPYYKKINGMNVCLNCGGHAGDPPEPCIHPTWAERLSDPRKKTR